MRLLFVLLGHLSGCDVFEVLQPLKVRTSDTSTVGEKVGGADNATSDEDLLSSVGGRSVGTFNDALDLNFLGIAQVKRLLNGCGNKEVSLLFQECGGLLGLSLNGSGETNESAFLGHPGLNSLNIETIWVVDGGVVLNDSGDLATVFGKEVRGPVSDRAETLNDEGLVLDAWRYLDFVAVVLIAEQFTSAVIDTETS